MLGIDLGNYKVVCLAERERRTDYGFRDVGRATLVAEWRNINTDRVMPISRFSREIFMILG
jgi:hypothetical protein